MPFLSLPIELRFQIYAYFAVPHDAPLSDYAGLYLSCHQVKAELDSEGSRLLKAHLFKVAARVPGLEIDLPITMGFLAMQHVHIVIDTRIWEEMIYLRCGALASFHQLHLSSITITYRRETGIALLTNGYTPRNAELVQIMREDLGTVLTRKIVVESSSEYGRSSCMDFAFHLYFNKLEVLDGWKFRCVDTSHRPAKAVWERK